MLQFEGYTLDIARNSLRTADRKIALQRKSFDLLRYLAENPDRVVTKEELLKAIWPDVLVTKESKDWIGPPSRCCPSPNLSDAISEDITTELSQFSELMVITRNSSFQYKGKAVDIRHADSSLVPSFRRRLPDDNSEKGL